MTRSDHHREAYFRKQRRPQQYTNIEVVIAAWVRGWSQHQIALAAGVTHQRIQQRIEKFENKYGKIERRGTSKHNISVSSRSWRCAHCDKLTWSPLGRFTKAGLEMFCCIRCLVDHKRVITDTMIERAIDMRWAGKSWITVAAEIGYCQQTIQSRIWKHLYQIGMLTLDVVESIWKPHGQRHFAWNWLERHTGIICTETGARLDHPIYRPGSPWGSRIVRDGQD